MDAVLALDPALPKRSAVEQAIRSAVNHGILGQGTRLPASRELALELGVARNTVVAALDDLIAEGLLSTRTRNGVYVARGTPGSTIPSSPGPARSARLDLRPGRAEEGSFPATRWTAALRRALPTLDDARADPAGVWPLREELAGYLRQARGVAAHADAMVICSGFRSASTMLAVALAARGATTVAVEDPSLPGSAEPWRAAGLQVVDLPVDAGGADVHRLSGDIDVVVLTPSHQFPMGGALTPHRRQLVCEWAMSTGGLIVEDDYDGEFRFDRRPVAALHRAAPDRVVYIGSTSKTLGAVRLGWLVLPADLVAPVVAAAQVSTSGPGPLEQLTLAQFIATGDYTRHIRRQRREYGRRRSVLREALLLRGFDIAGVDAGLHALVPLPAGFTPTGPFARALAGADGTAISTLAGYARAAVPFDAIIVGFGTPPRHRYNAAVQALLTLLP